MSRVESRQCNLCYVGMSGRGSLRRRRRSWRSKSTRQGTQGIKVVTTRKANQVYFRKVEIFWKTSATVGISRGPGIKKIRAVIYAYTKPGSEE
jgi:hypothetical protein